MNNLSSVLHNLIRTHGPLTVESYMQHCLYHPEHGYYTRGLNFTDVAHPLGRDFTTAPDLTPYFGTTLANWVHKEWQRLGQPTAFTLLEAGPGRGSLMHALLTQLHISHPTCYAAAHPTLIETSPALTHLQQQTLSSFPQCRWQTELLFPTKFPNSPPNALPTQFPTLLIGNELLDAFPIRQFAGDTERTIFPNTAGSLTFSHPNEAITREDSPQQTAWLQKAKSICTSMLLIDYGYTLTPNTYHLTPDTLQALHRHQKVSPLHLPGETDLTAHVNFTAAAQTLGSANCCLTDLSPFLMQHGFLTLAEPTINQPDTAAALYRLFHPSGMGALFKAIEYRT